MLQMYIHYISTPSALIVYEILLYLKNLGDFLLQIILIFEFFKFSSTVLLPLKKLFMSNKITDILDCATKCN